MLKIDAGEKKKVILRVRLAGDAIDRADLDDVRVYMDHLQTGRKIMRSIVTQNIPTTAVNITTDVITLADHGFVDGDRFPLTTTGVLPTGLSLATNYFVVQSSKDSFKLSATEGGTAIDLTAVGSGVHSIAGLGLAGSGDVKLGKYELTLETWVTQALKKAASQALTAHVEGPSIGPEIIKKTAAYSVE